MRLLTASILLVLASSNLLAVEIVPSVADTARFAPPARNQHPAADFSALLKPVAEGDIGTFVPFDDGPRTVAEINEAPSPPPETICETVASAAAANDLPLAFFLRLIWQESRFDPLAISRAGAQGVAQFMPRVAAEMGLADPFDPAQALPMSAQFLRALRERFGNLGLAAAAYNAGSGRIQNWLAKRSKLPKETRDYVVNITGHALERWLQPAQNSISLKVPAQLPCRMPEAAIAAAVPMPPQRPDVTSPVTAAFADSEAERVSTARPYRPATRVVADRTSGVSAHVRLVRSPQRARAPTAMLATPKPSDKAPKILASTRQQRAVIFVNRKSDVASVKLADKTAPAKRVVAQLAGKNWSAKVIHVKLAADKGPPQRVRVALDTGK